MKKLLIGLGLLLTAAAYAADIKISQLPLGSASTTTSSDSFPFVSASTNTTKRLTLWDISNTPTIVSTYAQKANPTFTGTLTAPAFILSGQNANTVPYLNGSKAFTSSTVTPTELGRLSGVTASLCGISQSCVLTNKTISGSSNTLSNIARSSISAGTASEVVINDGSGDLSSEPQLAVSRGGTGLASGSSGGVLAFTGTTTIASTAAGTTGQLLRSAGTSSPTWTTATFPSTTTANQLLYSSATNTVGGLSSANTGVLVTSSSGVPSIQACTTANRVLRTDGSALTCSQVAAATDISGQLAIANGGTGAATKAAAFDALSPMSAIGDLIYGGASGTGTRLPNGTTGQFLIAATGAAPVWTTVTVGNLAVASKTSNYTVTSSDGLLLGDSSGGAFTFTLPAASSNSGKIFYFKKTDSGANAITIARAGSDTIDGATSITIVVQYQSTMIVSDGVSAWSIL